ncbi:hypothetical protein BH23BAC3_BH23BAC3_29530 [soil metagenome]
MFNTCWIAFLFIGISEQANAQDSFRVSAQAGIQVLNSDHVTTADNEGNQAYVFGLGVSSRRVINEIPVDITLNLSQGQTEIIEQQNVIDETSNSTDLRYRSLTVEAMRVFGLTDLVEFSVVWIHCSKILNKYNFAVQFIGFTPLETTNSPGISYPSPFLYSEIESRYS